MSTPDKLSQPAAEWVPVADLAPWADNPRRNDDAAKEVAKSIQRFGFGAPILARRSDGVVIAGHTRLKAAALLGLDKVPVRYLDLDPAEARALALADNKLGELADWDAEMLGDVLRDLEAEGTSLDGLGWDADELRALMADPVVEPSENDDDAPEVDEHGEPDSVLGGAYELGPHRLVCGDCLDESVREACLDVPPDATVTDPPYGIGASKMTMGAGQSKLRSEKRLSNVEAWDESAPPVGWIPSVAPLACIWGGNYLSTDLPVSDDWLIWHKKNDGRSFAEAELAWSNFGCRIRVLQHHWGGEEKQHITQKPAAVLVWCLGLIPGARVVFDPFGGSGTTLIAAATLGRVARLIELDPRYCDVIRRRWTRWAHEHGRDPGPGALDG